MSLTRSELWILSEWQVAVHRVRNFNEVLVAHRERFAGVEVDLVFRESTPPWNLTIVEVKSGSGDLWGLAPISPRQRQRLLRAAAFLLDNQDDSRTEIGLKLAVVSHNSQGYLRPCLRYFDLVC